jgi:pantoate--beta-alanine ligase
MKVFYQKNDLDNYIGQFKEKGLHIGFVPTMGALHRGHLALVEASLRDNDITVVSIFVNPTQFDNPDDLKKYPRTFEQDLKLLAELSKDIIVYHPDANDFYDGHIVSQSFDFDGLESEMEGKHRPGHFDGVGTVVKKLFEIVKPGRAYFGEKDFQQLQIIKKLVEKEQLPVKIIPVPIYREADGLAMSSRNRRLTPQHRAAAPFIYQILLQAKLLFEHYDIQTVKKFVYDAIAAHPLLQIEYFEIADEKKLKPVKTKISGNNYRGFIVVYAGDIRLIDNIRLA